MIDDEIITKFLDAAVKKAQKNIEETGTLRIDDAIPIMLKSQFNHIAHLDERITSIEENMVTKQEFNEKFGELKSDFGELKSEIREVKSTLNTFMITMISGVLLILASPFLTQIIHAIFSMLH